jgi:hypothetical protein
MSIDLQSLARYGAHARLAELTNEIQTILSAFPELKPGGNTPGRRRYTVRAERMTAMDTGGSNPDASRQSSRRPMSAAARKAVSDRMKQYWARRRKAAAK